MIRRSVLGLAAALALSACASSPKVSTDTAPGANFAAYQSFTVVNQTAPRGMNPVTFERMRQGVESALTSKGYTSSSNGDLSVVITVGARDKTDISTYGWYGRQVDVYQYVEGKMSVDVFDSKTRQALWHGQATQTIDPGKSAPAELDAAVASVMASFPPRA